jgi:hypothetical protein
VAEQRKAPGREMVDKAKVVGAPGETGNAFCGESFGRMTTGGGAGDWSPRVSGQPTDLEAARLHLSLSLFRYLPC